MENNDTGFTETKSLGEVDERDIKFEERKRWVFFGLPFTFTKYTITPFDVRKKEGFLRTVENECYMYKIVDVRLVRTLFERIFKLGTVVCYTGDTTDRELKLYHIKHSREVRDYIHKASEEARLKRRTINTMNLTPGDMENMPDDVDVFL